MLRVQKTGGGGGGGGARLRTILVGRGYRRIDNASRRLKKGDEERLRRHE